MALPATGIWEVRSGGSSGNGGGRDPVLGASGLDYSLQTSPQVSVTDAVANGTTTITSATAAFTALMIGNFLKIGAAWYVMTGFNSATSITVDRTVSAASGLTLKLGGALALPTDVVGVRVPGQVIYWQGPSLNIAATLNLSDAGADGAPHTLIGYVATRGDLAQVTLRWTGAANGTIMDVGGAQNILWNFTFDGNGKSADRGLRFNAANCTGVNIFGKDCALSALDAINTGAEFYFSEATNNGSTAGSTGFNLGSNGRCFACASYGNVGNGFAASNVNGQCYHCEARGNAKSGFYLFGSGSMTLINCLSDGNTLDGLRLDGSPEDSNLTLINNLFSNNVRYGIASLSTDYSGAANTQQGLARRWNNAFYNNTLGARFQFPAGTGDLTPTVDPYTSRSTFDFSLNGNAGGGATLRGAGIPGRIGLITTPQNTVGHQDVGLVSGPSVGGSGSAYQTMLTMWREMTGEHDAATIDDTIPAFWIDAGLEALNRRIRYHWTTDSTSIVLVAGTQEYSLPADLVELRWVEWNGRELKKGDPEEWRRRLDEWRSEPAGEPLQWAIYANKLIIRPTPSAEAVAAAASPVFRYCSKPPAVSTGGADLLNSQDYRVPVLYGAAAYCQSYPDSAVAQQRAAALMKAFDDEATVIAQDYGDRLLKK